jgi:hypothetical protein
MYGEYIARYGKEISPQTTTLLGRLRREDQYAPHEIAK